MAQSDCTTNFGYSNKESDKINRLAAIIPSKSVLLLKTGRNITGNHQIKKARRSCQWHGRRAFWSM